MNRPVLQFVDQMVPYEVFVRDLAREIVALQTEALRTPNDIISQNQAYRRFGAGWVLVFSSRIAFFTSNGVKSL